MKKKFAELRSRLAEINDLQTAGALLSWDQSTYMPPAAAETRAHQRATLARIAHEKLTDPALGKLLDDLKPYEESLPYDSDEASLLRVTRRDFEKATRVPAGFVAEMRAHGSAAYQIWTRARPANDFDAVRPYLEKTLELSRRYADFFPGYEHVADPLIDRADEGYTASELKAIFQALRKQLVPLVTDITSRPGPDDSCLRQPFPEPDQLAFGLEVVSQMGYDLARGREDKTHHPFTTRFALDDVRITTRVRGDDLREALFSTIHEAGHGMYEQGIARGFERTPLASGTSPGFHESQSRLWENLVGRSLPFWRHFYPRLQRVFPRQLDAVSLESFYAAINRVERSVIRVDADEVTYNLHVMLRFDLELQMLEGRLAVAGLPEAWRDRFEADLGVAPADDRNGVLQDVHWYSGSIGGGFQGYTLGNILSAQLFEAATRSRPSIPHEIESGKFETLLGWLTEQVYRHGRKYRAPELVRRATGGPLTIEPYVRYLRTKYGVGRA